MSFAGKVATAMARRILNMNPASGKDPATTMHWTDRFDKFRTNRGYVIERLVTPTGTKYERAYRKDSRFSGKAVLYLHGGGYMAGLTESYRKMAKPFGEAAGGAEFFLLDYVCAPERLYPSQLNEALDMWDELTERLGYDADNIIVGGDSAGGNLTLALLLSLRDKGKRMPRAAFCWSPWADMTASGESYVTNYPKDPLFGEKGKAFDENKRADMLKCSLFTYVGDADRKSPYVSPVYGDYAGFPPMFFAVGGDEMLLDDTLTIVKNLQQNGVDVELDIGPAMFHIYPMFAAFIPEGKVAFDKTIAFVKKHAK